MGKISNKVINTILALKDKLSEPLKKASEVTAKASKQLEKAKTQVKKYESTILNANKGINSAKENVNKLSKEYIKNQSQIEKVKSAIEKYSNTTGLTEKQMESYAKKLTEAKSKLKALENAQEANTRATDTARKVIADYEKVITTNGAHLNKARAKLKEYAKTIADVNKRVDENKKKLKEWGKSALRTMDSIIKKSIATAGAMGSIVGGYAIKTGFGQAMDIEGYKMQLVTATKSTEKASQLMNKAIKFANSTPFTTGEVVEATAKMEAYGISSKRWLKDVADMAGATNKSIDQATEAMADAVVGEFERLKEFGIKKEDIIAQATAKYGKAIVNGKRGEAKKREAIESTLQTIMQSKYKGGAEKQAKTLKGLWSTVVGVTQISLAKIVGITNEGTERQGSIYEKLKKHLEKVVAVLNKWQEDGTIDEIAEKVTSAVSNMIDFFVQLFNFIKKHRVLIETLLVFVGSIYTTIKAIAILKSAFTVLTIAAGILNGTIAISPLGWVVLTISAVVTACYLLWQHLDAVINVFKSLFAWIKSGLDSIGDFGFAFSALLGPIGLVISAVLGLIQHFDKVREVASKTIGFVKNLFGFGKSTVDVNAKTPGEKKPTPLPPPPPESEPIGIGKTKFKSVSTSPKTSSVYQNTSTTNSQSKKQEIHYNIELNGDFYGFKDFKEKVAEAVVKITNPNLSNMVR